MHLVNTQSFLKWLKRLWNIWKCYFSFYSKHPQQTFDFAINNFRSFIHLVRKIYTPLKWFLQTFLERYLIFQVNGGLCQNERVSIIIKTESCSSPYFFKNFAIEKFQYQNMLKQYKCLISWDMSGFCEKFYFY